MTYTATKIPARIDHKMNKEAVIPAQQRTQDERRRIPRIRDVVPVTLVPVRSFFGFGRISAEIRDFHDEAACMKSTKSVAVGRRLRVRLKIPGSVSRFYRGLPCEVTARVVSVRPVESAGERSFAVIVRWERPLSRSVHSIVRSYRLRMGTLVGLGLALIVWTSVHRASFFWYDPILYTYSLAMVAFLLSRFLFASFHKTPPMTSYLPSVSVVISVRNEENNIAHGVSTFFETDYPAGLREIVVVDDGSSDRTPEVLRQLQLRYPALKVFTIPPSGKRRGMAEGVLQVKGEIVVFMDSDTFLAPDALREIVCGFEDRSLGAVSGYTGVGNADKNALTGLQEIRYFVSFQLLKTSESLFGCVTCCPGCLSAYRREYLLEVLDPWLKQTFMGARATFGDDRSLTNFILRKYRVTYNELAIAYTMVPETWGHYLRQQCRWKKSWLRETFLACRFMFKKHPIAAISFYSASAFSLLSPAMSFRVAYLGYSTHDGLLTYYLVGLAFVGLIQSLFFLYRRPNPHWLLGIYWMATSLLITGPQTYYALLTLRKNHWGTR